MSGVDQERPLARIAGVNIPTAKRVEVALTYIHGIGPAKAKEIAKGGGPSLMTKLNELKAMLPKGKAKAE